MISEVDKLGHLDGSSKASLVFDWLHKMGADIVHGKPAVRLQAFLLLALCREFLGREPDEMVPLFLTLGGALGELKSDDLWRCNHGAVLLAGLVQQRSEDGLLPAFASYAKVAAATLMQDDDHQNQKQNVQSHAHSRPATKINVPAQPVMHRNNAKMSRGAAAKIADATPI